MSRPLRILQVHNAYRHRGGEDAVAEDEAALLRDHGHAVETLHLHNDDVAGMGRAELALRTLWSREVWSEVLARCARNRPDVVHVHNFMPLVSPSVHWAAHRAGVPVVQTLHNFRLLCPQAMFMREGRACTECLGRWPWRGVLHACYRESTAQSAVLASMLAVHRVAGTWQRRVSRFIALTQASRAVFVQAGLPAQRLCVKPNFVGDPGPAGTGVRRGVLFVGRLSPEKGLGPLLEAARHWPPGTLTVVGDGPLADRVRQTEGVTWLGVQPPTQVAQAMRTAQLLVLPSICQEQFPRTLVEAYAASLPVVANQLGALAELVEDGVTGALVPVGDAPALARKVAALLADPPLLDRLGRQARQRYEALYTPQRNHAQLHAIYEEAIAARAAGA